MTVSHSVAESDNRWYIRHPSNKEYTSLFRLRYFIVQNCSLSQSFLDMLPLFCSRKKWGKCRETTPSCFLLSIFMKYRTLLYLFYLFYPKKMSVPIRNEPHNCWLFRFNFSNDRVF